MTKTTERQDTAGVAEAIATITPATTQEISGPPLPMGMYVTFTPGKTLEGMRYYYAYRSPDGTVHLEEQIPK